MKNSKKNGEIISANEINKFAYCPYQWYYERTYGASHIRKLYNERNEALGLADTAGSNFRKGQAFHSGYFGRNLFAKAITIAVILLVLAALLFYFLWFRL